jgi:hypothetical protein
MASSYYFDCSVMLLSSGVVVELPSSIVVGCFVLLVGRLDCSEICCCRILERSSYVFTIRFSHKFRVNPPLAFPSLV